MPPKDSHEPTLPEAQGTMKLNLGQDYLSYFVFKEVSNTQAVIITIFGTDHKLKVQHSVTVQLPFVLSLWKQRLFNADIVTIFEKYKALCPPTWSRWIIKIKETCHSSHSVCTV